jgi:hypothetical protein
VVPESPEAKDTLAEEYSPLSDSEGEKLYHDAEEFESFRIEAPVPVGRLQALLVHLGITTAPKYQIEGVPHPGWVEFQGIVEIFHGSKVVSRHTGSAFRASNSDAISDAA